MSIVEWKAHNGDGLTGFVGRDRVFDIMPWTEEASRRSWQLQIRRDLFCQGEYVRAARTQQEAKLLAEELTRLAFDALNVVPADPDVAAAFFVPRSDPSRKESEDMMRSRHDWLRETGWYDPSV